jgi:hypothetical protein
VAIALAALAALCGAAPAAAAPGASSSAAGPSAGNAVGIQLLDGPAGAADPRARIYIVDQLAAGTAITRHVLVSNGSESPEDVALYAGAASLGGGSFVPGDGRSANELSSWVSIDTSDVTIPAQSSIQATVRIAVPGDASDGERYAVIWAQTSSPLSGQVTEAVRAGIRIYLDVHGGAAVPSDFSVTGVTAARGGDGTPQIRLALRNTGQRAVDVSGTVALSEGPGGTSVGPVQIAEAVTLAPGATGAAVASFDPALPAGPWLATASLASGTIQHQAASTVTFPAPGGTEVGGAPPGGQHHSALLWVAMAAVAVIISLLIILLLFRSRRTRSATSGAARPR